MTYIKRIELRSFKSSGVKPLIVNLEKGFNVITGPNGSGKSNIADAILFVLGENSPKQLRAAGGRLSGLIYDPRREDTVSSQRPSSCRVTVQFDNSDRAIPVDSDNVTITRELNEKGESNYYLNGKKITRSSLSEILEISGLSPSGLNIVPQGAATRVSDLTPEEKRKLIEEIVGISQFDERKAEAQRQLNQADQRLEVAMARIGEMRSYLERLDIQRNELMRLNVLEYQLNWLRAVMTSRRIAEVRNQISLLEKQEEELSNKIRQHSDELSKTEQEISDAEKEKTRFIVEVIQGGGKSHVELQLQLAQVTNELDSVISNLNDARQNAERLEKEVIPYLRSVVQSKEREVSQCNSRIKELSLALEQLEGKRKELSSRLEELIEAQSIIRETIEKNSRKEARILEKLKELNDRINSDEIVLGSVNASIATETKRLEELKKRTEGYSTIISELEQGTSKLSQLYSDATNSLKELDKNMDEVEKKKERISSIISYATQTFEKVRQEVLKNNALISLRETVFEGENEKKLRELCEKGGVPGYIARLRELISFKEEHRKAVHSVFGSLLDSYVVRDASSMARMIKAAKKLGVKKLTIMPLSELEGFQETRNLDVVGVLGPLCKFVSSEEEYRCIVNFITANTYLVSNEAIAYLVCSDGYRAVTLEGELFEQLGRYYKRGYEPVPVELMPEIEEEQDFEEINSALEKLREAIRRRKLELEQFELASKSLGKERIKKIAGVSSIKAELSAFSRISRRYRSVFRAVLQEYQKQQRVVQRLERKRASIENGINSMKRAVDALNKTISSLKELNLSAMQSEIEQTIKEIESELGVVRNEIAERSLELTKERANLENVLLRTLENNKLDLESSIQEYNEELKFIKQAPLTIRELEQKKAELEQQIEKLKESSRKSQPVLDEFDTKIRKLKEKRDSVARALTLADKELFTVKSKKEQYSDRLQELKGSLSMLGYSDELEYFEGADLLLKEIEQEYAIISSRVNRSADKQYKEAYLQYKNLSVRYNELEKERNAIISFIEKIEREKRNVFLTSFEKIKEEFSQIFKKLTNGDAWLELENPDDIFSGGLLLYAKFGTKPAWESSSLSGGEKAVVGVSFILAMQSVRQHPFYLFDEIDSALDALNSSNLADFFVERSNVAQIIAITLRDVFVAKSNITYGVYSAGGVSRLVHYKPAEVRS